MVRSTPYLVRIAEEVGPLQKLHLRAVKGFRLVISSLHGTGLAWSWPELGAISRNHDAPRRSLRHNHPLRGKHRSPKLTMLPRYGEEPWRQDCPFSQPFEKHLIATAFLRARPGNQEVAPNPAFGPPGAHHNQMPHVTCPLCTIDFGLHDTMSCHLVWVLLRFLEPVSETRLMLNISVHARCYAPTFPRFHVPRLFASDQGLLHVIVGVTFACWRSIFSPPSHPPIAPSHSLEVICAP